MSVSAGPISRMPGLLALAEPTAFIQLGHCFVRRDQVLQLSFEDRGGPYCFVTLTSPLLGFEVRGKAAESAWEEAEKLAQRQVVGSISDTLTARPKCSLLAPWSLDGPAVK